jgi:serine O-acetyltransferase
MKVMVRVMFEKIKADVERYRVTGNYQGGISNLIKMWLVHEPLWYILVWRTGSYFKQTCTIPIIRQTGLIIFYMLHRILSNILNIQIPLNAKVGKGLYIPHYGMMVIHPNVIIGEHCNIGHGSTIGIAGRGEKKGTPVIGNYVYIAPGAKVVGKIKIGNNVMIGANAVVTKDIPNNAVVAGVPAKIISFKGWDTPGNPYQIKA